MKMMRAGERRRVTLSGASPTTGDITSVTTNAEASILKVEETSTTAETTSVDMTLKENTTTDEPTTRACTTTGMTVKTSKTTSNKPTTVVRSTGFGGVDRARTRPREALRSPAETPAAIINREEGGILIYRSR